MTPRPRLITFDMFGTVLDWRSGLEEACRAAGRPMRDGEFDRVVDAQGALEQGEFSDYARITSRSLVDVLGMREADAAWIGAAVGRWPLYADAAALRPLMTIAPCAAMTNSDIGHGEEIQARLGFHLDAWLCSEETRRYKPNPEFWHDMGRLLDVRPGPDWWHVSAYADYDLRVGNDLGLTTVFVDRPHSRPGPATHTGQDLTGLLALLR